MSLDAPAQKAFDGIRRAYAARRLAQAYVIVGPPRGAGLDLARRILALLFCAAADERPCGCCAACRAAEAGTLPDVMTLEPLKKAQMIDIAQVRALNRFAAETSYAGGWKAGLLLVADRITTGAANAFLKTLEEPPSRTLFLLLTEQPDALLPTLQSRCHKVIASAGGREAVRPWMERLGPLLAKPTSSAFEALSAAAELTALLQETRAAIEEEDPETSDSDDDTASEAATAVREARLVARYKEARLFLMRALLLWQRDALTLVCGSDPALLAYADQAAALRDLAARLTPARALARVETVEQMQAQLEDNVGEALVLESGFLRLAELEAPNQP